MRIKASLALFPALSLTVGMVHSAPKRLELGFPQLAERVQVVLPGNYSPDRKWPAIFYYHGTGGRPTTELIQAHTQDQDWIVVGMTYTQEGNLPATAEYIEKEFRIFSSTRRHLAAKWNLDPRRCYVAGFSKGGWMAGFLLQHDPGLAGAVILGAGHQFLIRKPAKFRGPQSLFVGIGRQDETYPFALRALVHYRPLGARTTFETWHGLGHRFPENGSSALRQWLEIEANPKGDHQIAAEEWVNRRIDEIKGMPNLVDQWVAFRDLEKAPYLRALGEEAEARVRSLVTKLEKGGRVAAEGKAQAAHRLLLREEAKGHTIPLCQRLAGDYLALSEAHRGTRQAEIALGDHERMKKLALHFKEQLRIMKEKEAEAQKKKDLIPPEGKNPDPFKRAPDNRPRIPRNPLVPPRR